MLKITAAKELKPELLKEAVKYLSLFLLERSALEHSKPLWLQYEIFNANLLKYRDNVI